MADAAERAGIRRFVHPRWAPVSRHDEKDAADLADLLRMGGLAEAWVAPAEIRELLELTRYRQKPVRARTSVKDHGLRRCCCRFRLGELSIPGRPARRHGVASFGNSEIRYPHERANCHGTSSGPH
jgi:hypothetical protein